MTGRGNKRQHELLLAVNFCNTSLVSILIRVNPLVLNVTLKLSSGKSEVLEVDVFFTVRRTVK